MQPVPPETVEIKFGRLVDDETNKNTVLMRFSFLKYHNVKYGSVSDPSQYDYYVGLDQIVPDPRPSEHDSIRFDSDSESDSDSDSDATRFWKRNQNRDSGLGIRKFALCNGKYKVEKETILNIRKCVSRYKEEVFLDRTEQILKIIKSIPEDGNCYFKNGVLHPLMSLANEKELSTENNEDFLCGICHEQITRGESVCEYACLHMFHTGCAKKWENAQKRQLGRLGETTCPTCRAAGGCKQKYLRDEDGDKGGGGGGMVNDVICNPKGSRFDSWVAHRFLVSGLPKIPIPVSLFLSSRVAIA